MLTGIEVCADTAAKIDGETFNSDAVLYGGYLSLAYVLRQVLPNNSIALTNAYWNAATNVTHLAIGKMYFGEEITTQQMIGIGVITVGILLVHNGG